MNRTVKILLAINLLVLLTVLARPFLVLPFASAQSPSKAAAQDNPELTRLMDEDQADVNSGCAQPKQDAERLNSNPPQLMWKYDTGG